MCLPGNLFICLLNKKKQANQMFGTESNRKPQSLMRIKTIGIAYQTYYLSIVVEHVLPFHWHAANIHDVIGFI